MGEGKFWTLGFLPQFSLSATENPGGLGPPFLFVFPCHQSCMSDVNLSISWSLLRWATGRVQNSKLQKVYTLTRPQGCSPNTQLKVKRRPPVLQRCTIWNFHDSRYLNPWKQYARFSIREPRLRESLPKTALKGTHPFLGTRNQLVAKNHITFCHHRKNICFFWQRLLKRFS